MEKNKEYIGTVCAIGSNGEGIIKQDNAIIFVPYTLVGEKVRFKVLKVASKCVYAKALEILTPAEERVRPNCPVYTKCGGCQLQHVKYQKQLIIKEQAIKDTFKKVANIIVDVLPAVSGDNEYRYRNKLQLPVCSTDKGTVIGFYAENSHRVVPITDCPINAFWTKDIISAFSKYITENNIIGYNEFTNTGDLREITVKDVNGKLIITAVINNEKIRGIDKLVEILKSFIKLPFSLYLNINNKQTNVIYGDEFRLVYGNADYTSEMLGIKYKIGVQSFMQVNNSVCYKLYSNVKSLVNADENMVVIDAYSGAGLMTAILAQNAKKAIGVEIIPEAVECANDLAKINKLDHKITNYCGKCEDILPQIIADEKQKGSDVCLVLDPPRKGCDIKVINAIINSNIDKIIYVSCKPSTLARDVGLLVGTLGVEGGEIKKVDNPKQRYKIELVKPFDMFAQTKHVETLVALERI